MRLLSTGVVVDHLHSLVTFWR